MNRRVSPIYELSELARRLSPLDRFIFFGRTHAAAAPAIVFSPTRMVIAERDDRNANIATTGNVVGEVGKQIVAELGLERV